MSKELANLSLKEFKQARKRDAMALARLVYDMYKEEKRSKIISGQNNAQTTSTK